MLVTEKYRASDDVVSAGARKAGGAMTDFFKFFPDSETNVHQFAGRVFAPLFYFFSNWHLCQKYSFF